MSIGERPFAPRLRSLWRNLRSRSRVEEDLSEELNAHLEMVIASKVAAGLDPAEARRQAILELGGMEQVKEGVREVRVGRALETILQDLRYGVRTLRRSPGFAATVLLSVTLGLAANTAIFSLVNALLLRSLPVREPARLVLFQADDGSQGRGPHPPGRLKVFSYPLYQRVGAENLFEGVAAEQSGDTTAVVKTTAHDSTEADAVGRCVSASYFQVLGVPALRGRTFGPSDETAPGANPVLVLSHHYWKRRFAGDPAVVGARVSVNGTPFTVVGIAPAGFVGLNVARPSDFWIPLTMQPELTRSESRLGRSNEWWLLVVGRLGAGVSVGTAEAKVNLVLQQFLAAAVGVVEPGGKRQQIRVALEPGAQGIASFRRNARDPLLTLMAGVGLLLVIVLVNVSLLLLARANDRRRELSIRTALGATRSRLLRQLLTEALLLSALGAAAATLVTPWLTAGLLSLANTRALDVSADVRVLSFTALLAVATTLLLGLVPARQASRTNLQHHLQAALTAARSRRLVTRLLLVAQVALSLVLLVGAGLLASSLARLRGAEKGFEPEHLLLVEINPRLTGLRRDPRPGVPPPGAATLYDDVLRRVTALPGVTGASLSVHGLLSGSSWRHDLTVVGTTTKVPAVAINGVSPGYFASVGMSLLRGRSFTEGDHQRATRVAVINQALARRLFGDADPVGKRLRDADPGDVEVVGVVRDARTAGVSQEPQPMFFAPLAQQDWFASTLEVRTTGDPGLLTSSVRGAVREAHPTLPILSMRTMRAQVDRLLTGERLLATLSIAFGLAALFLVCLGLYGVMARWAAQRVGEIGVRMALGATAGSVRWMVLRQALILVLAGLAVGLPAAMAASRLLQRLLFGVKPMDPLTLVTASLTLFAVATLAAYLPAHRASRVDPVVALRCE